MARQEEWKLCSASRKGIRQSPATAQKWKFNPFTCEILRPWIVDFRFCGSIILMAVSCWPSWKPNSYLGTCLYVCCIYILACVCVWTRVDTRKKCKYLHSTYVYYLSARLGECLIQFDLINKYANCEILILIWCMQIVNLLCFKSINWAQQTTQLKFENAATFIA